MKSVFEASTRQELINRINSLTEQSTRQWGKMNVFEMLQHCTRHEDMMLGKIKIKRVLPGYLIGKIVLKNALKEGKPMFKNAPTHSSMKTIGQSGDLERQKKEWIKCIEEFSKYDDLNIVHPFYGPMNKEQIGQYSYKHDDHHLRQFSV